MGIQGGVKGKRIEKIEELNRQDAKFAKEIQRGKRRKIKN